MKMKPRLLLISICATLLMWAGASAEWKSYKGIYSSGFENSSFRPCGSEEVWWLESVQEASLEYHDFYSDLSKDLPKSQVGDLTELPENGKGLGNRMFVYVHGFVYGPGEYGHMGYFTHKISVRKYYTIRLATEADLRNCGA